MQLKVLSNLAFLAMLIAPAVEAQLDVCAGTGRPGATLLYPYFGIDLDDPNAEKTLISIKNASPDPALAHVVLWSNCGLPVLDFDLYLARGAIRSIDLSSVVAFGQLPSSGPAKDDENSFPGCTVPLSLPVLDKPALTRLQARLVGEPDPVDGLCYAEAEGETRLATGYVTVDVVKGCSESIHTPYDDGYFAADDSALASDDNILWGDFYFIDDTQDSAQGFAAVTLLAGDEMVGTDGRSFYGLGDRRQPLPQVHVTRFFNGGAFTGGTDLLLWLDLRGPTEPMTCLGRCRSARYLHLQELPEAGGEPQTAFFRVVTKITQRLRVGKDVPVSSIVGSLKACNVPVQSWVLPIHRATGRFSVGTDALHLCRSDLPSAKPTEEVGQWLLDRIAALECEPKSSAPAEVWRYTYQGQVVYYLPVYACCDHFSELYDEAGELVCFPSGGVGGHGDGQCPDFFSARGDETLIWRDSRTF